MGTASDTLFLALLLFGASFVGGVAGAALALFLAGQL